MPWALSADVHLFGTALDAPTCPVSGNAKCDLTAYQRVGEHDPHRRDRQQRWPMRYGANQYLIAARHISSVRPFVAKDCMLKLASRKVSPGCPRGPHHASSTSCVVSSSCTVSLA